MRPFNTAETPSGLTQ